MRGVDTAAQGVAVVALQGLGEGPTAGLDVEAPAPLSTRLCSAPGITLEALVVAAGPTGPDPPRSIATCPASRVAAVATPGFMVIAGSPRTATAAMTEPANQGRDLSQAGPTPRPDSPVDPQPCASTVAWVPPLLTGQPLCVKTLTKTARLGKTTFTAATGRRAVEHPPRPEFHWRRGFALSVVSVTGYLQHRVAGGRGCHGEACS